MLPREDASWPFLRSQGVFVPFVEVFKGWVGPLVPAMIQWAHDWTC